MTTSIYKVLSHSEAQTITKADGSTIQKSTVVLQELGGQYQDSFAAALLGNQIRFYSNDLVAANLRFQEREYNGNHYQDVTITEIRKLA